MEKTTEKSLFDIPIKPQNRMTPAELNRLVINENPDDSKAIVEMKEGELMPLYMFVGKLRMGDNWRCNLMCSVMHLVKTNEIEIRGRMRYEETGNKTIFNSGKKSISDLEKAKDDIDDVYQGMIRVGLCEADGKPTTLEFEKDEPIESIMKKMEASDCFNIGVVPTA